MLIFADASLHKTLMHVNLLPHKPLTRTSLYSSNPYLPIYPSLCCFHHRTLTIAYHDSFACFWLLNSFTLSLMTYLNPHGLVTHPLALLFFFFFFFYFFFYLFN